jgi:carboxylesterase
MHYLGRRLADMGFTVVGPLLAGHGETVEALNATTWEDWYDTVEREFDALRQRCSRVAVIGQSLGALLTLHLARRRRAQLSAIAVMAAPLWLDPFAELAIPLVGRVARLSRVLRSVPKLGGGSDVRDQEMRRQNPALRDFPVFATESLRECMRVVRAEVPHVDVPAFVAHGQYDHTAPPACSDEIVSRIKSTDVRYLVLPRSFHILGLDVDRELLADALGRFLAERM